MFGFINLLTGRRWWYEVTIEYRDRQGRLLHTGRTQIGLVTRSDILDSREMKKNLAKWFFGGIHRYDLCNGKVQFHAVAYLGWLKLRKTPKGPRMALEDLFSAYLGMMLLESRKAR